jgi:predicted nuclease of predicted toxin-antitoxin system
MKLLFDANLSPHLIEALTSNYPGSKHVQELDLKASDRQIWDFAVSQQLTIVTKDSDFDTLAFLLAPPGKVIRVTLGNCSTTMLAKLLNEEFQIASDFISDPNETLLIIP